MPNLSIKGCDGCGHGKSNLTHTFGTYRVFEGGDILKLVCKTCKRVYKYRYIQGGI